MKYIFRIKKQSIKTKKWNLVQEKLIRSADAWRLLYNTTLNPTELMNRLSNSKSLNIVVSDRVMYSFTRVEPEILK